MLLFGKKTPPEATMTMRQFIDSRADKKQVLLYDYEMGIEFFKALTGTEEDFVYRLMGNLNKYFGFNRIAYYEKLPNDYRLLCNIGKNESNVGDFIKVDNFPMDFTESKENLIHMKNAGILHDLYVPIFDRDGGELIRLFAMDNTELESELSQDAVSEMKTVTKFISYFITTKVHSDNERIKDPLTGAHRRNVLMELPAKEFAKVSSMAYLDIDDFKALNTEYGHPMADEVLKAFVKFVQFRIRASEGDKIIRMGGDEFVVLFTKVSHRQAKNRLKEIVREFSASQIEGINTKIHLTGGIVECKPGLDREDLIAKANRLMLDQKAVGKNKISSETD